ncbi:MAG: hypothetical protein ACLVB1_02905 [Blautia obeum]
MLFFQRLPFWFQRSCNRDRCLDAFTNTSIFENSSQYTQTIIQQMNQNIDSYIDYMENIAYLISSNEDVQDYLFSDEVDNEGRYRILKQFETILDSRSDIRM